MPSLFIGNLHDDMGFEVAKAVEEEKASPIEAFQSIYDPRMREGQVGLQFYTVGGDAPRFCGQPDLSRGVYKRLDIVAEAVRHTQDYRIIYSPADLRLVLDGSQRGLVLTIEGALPAGEDLSTLRNFYRLGLRSVCLLWFKANQVGDGVGEARKAGLTNFGRKFVQEMNRLGMLIDIAQACERTAWDVLETSNAPIVASHSNASGQYGHVRNLTDDQIRAIAKGGGLIGLTSYPAHLRKGTATIDDYIAHIDYVVELVGPDSVCFGLNIISGSKEVESRFFNKADIEYQDLWLSGLEDITQLPRVVEQLDKRGYKSDVIAKIAGGNLVRVLQNVLKG